MKIFHDTYYHTSDYLEIFLTGNKSPSLVGKLIVFKNKSRKPKLFFYDKKEDPIRREATQKELKDILSTHAHDYEYNV